MSDYNFRQDFFDTYQSLSDWLKILWLIVPPAFVLALTAMILHFRVQSRRTEIKPAGELVYSVHRDAENRFHIISHTRHLHGKPAALFPDQTGNPDHGDAQKMELPAAG
jgi:hypothetical protein